jgi:hypothetical protein
MEAVAWTAIGILAATLLGNMFYLGSRIDNLATRLDSRIDSLEAKVDGLGSRLDARLDSLGSRLDAHLERHAG